MRGSYLYGNVKDDKSVKFTSSNGARLGTSERPDYSGTVFEVADEFKGDIARTYFYMATSYQSVVGKWGHGVFTSDNYTRLTSYALNLFLEWNESDPVSQREIDRNNGIYKHQKNRNPYIDVPNLGEYIFGK